MAELRSPGIQVSVRTPATTLHILDFLPSFNMEASPYFYIKLARKLTFFSLPHRPNSPPILSFSSLHWFLVLTGKPGSPEHSNFDSPRKWAECAEHGPSVQRPFRVQRTQLPFSYSPLLLLLIASSHISVPMISKFVSAVLTRMSTCLFCSKRIFI